MLNALVCIDISSKIGTGHFRRMRHLSKAMKKKSVLFTYLIFGIDNQNNNIFNEVNTIFIANGQKFFEYIERNLRNFDLLIFDFLKYPDLYFNNMKKQINIDKPIIAFYEYENFDYSADLVINYNLFNGWRDYDEKKVLAGPKYTIFNENIIDYKQNYNYYYNYNYNNNNNNNVFVSFGGSDPSNFTHQFLELIATKNLKFNYNILIGAMHYGDLLNYEKYNNIKIYKGDVNIFSLMTQCSLCITAGGNTMYEATYLGLPTCVLAHNEHQHTFAKNLQKDFLQTYVGMGSDVNWSKVMNFISTEHKTYKNDIIDNLGVTRITQRILEVLS